MQPNPNWAVISNKYREKLSWDHHFPKKWSSAPLPILRNVCTRSPRLPYIVSLYQLETSAVSRIASLLIQTSDFFVPHQRETQRGIIQCRMCFPTNLATIAMIARMVHRQQRINAVPCRCFGPIHGLDTRCFVWPVQIALS